MAISGDQCVIAYGDATQAELLTSYIAAGQNLHIQTERDTRTPMRTTAPEQDENQYRTSWELDYLYGAPGAPQIVGAGLANPWIAGVAGQHGAIQAVRDTGLAATPALAGRISGRATLPPAGALFTSEHVGQWTISGGDASPLVSPSLTPTAGGEARSAVLDLDGARPLLLLDAMMPRAVANGLPPVAGVVMAADRPALRTGSDVLLFAAALEEELAVVTRNVGDFRVLAEQAQGAGSPCPAVILVTARRFPEGPGSVGPITTALRRLCADGIEAGRSTG